MTTWLRICIFRPKEHAFQGYNNTDTRSSHLMIPYPAPGAGPRECHEYPRDMLLSPRLAWATDGENSFHPSWGNRVYIFALASALSLPFLFSRLQQSIRFALIVAAETMSLQYILEHRDGTNIPNNSLSAALWSYLYRLCRVLAEKCSCWAFFFRHRRHETVKGWCNAERGGFVLQKDSP